MTTRKQFEVRLLEEVQSWIGVPFLHNGRSKSQGVDCLGLIYLLCKETGLDLPDGDGTGYRYDWFLHTPEDRYMDGLLKYGDKVERKDLRIGDILLFKPGLITPSKLDRVTHAGLYVGDGRFVHSRNGTTVEITELSYKAWDLTYAGAYRLRRVAEAPM